MQNNNTQYSYNDFASFIHYTFFDFFKHDPSWMIYISDTNGQYNLWKQKFLVQNKIDSNNYSPIQMTSFIDESVRAIFCSPVNNNVIFFADYQGNENYQIYCLDIINHNIWSITENQNIKYEWGSECYSNDGRYITYSSNEKSSSTLQVYVMDLKQNEIFSI